MEMNKNSNIGHAFQYLLEHEKKNCTDFHCLNAVSFVLIVIE